MGIGNALRTAAAMAGILALLASCSDNTASPGIQPEVSNLPDTFSYQVTNVQSYTGEQTYSWSNSGTTANVDQSTAVTGGTMTLVITDDLGTEVYSRSLADDGNFPTTAGTAGTWTIRVVYTDASGTVNFRVQKTT